MPSDQELMANALAGLPATAPQPVAKGWLDYLKDFASGGVHGALKGTQHQLPAWADAPARVMQNPDFNAAVGMGARWTPKTIDMLKGHFAQGRPTGLPVIPGHSQQAVAVKAQELGLHTVPRKPFSGSYQELKPPDTSLPVQSPLYKKSIGQEKFRS